MKFPGGSAHNWAEENAVFKVPSWKVCVILTASKRFGKLTLASWIYLCLKPKNTSLYFKMYLKF